MSGFKELPRKDTVVLIASLLLVSSVYAASFYSVYVANKEETVEFKVFAVHVHYYPELRGNQTQILTWGTGKYYFIGTWLDSFELDHSYRVTYVRQPSSPRPWQHLVILEMEDITV